MRPRTWWAFLLAWPCLVAQGQVSPASPRDEAHSLLENLAAPAAVNSRPWHKDLQREGINRQALCAGRTEPACVGLRVGSLAPPPVTISLLPPAVQVSPDEIYRIDDRCELRAVPVPASQAAGGRCLGNAGEKPGLQPFRITVTTIISRDNYTPAYRRTAEYAALEFNADGFQLNKYTISWEGMENLYGSEPENRRQFEEYTEKAVLGYLTAADFPACGEGRLRECELTTIAETCIKAVGGECSLWLSEFRCGAAQRWECEQPVACSGGECPDLFQASHAAAFPAALAQLEALRQAASYVELDAASQELRIFRGTQAQCRDKVIWGLADCCRGSPPSSATHNRAVLANLGVSLAIRGVESIGNPHVHDLLFASSDLQRSLSGLGAGVQGLVSSLSPSLSHYGMKVALSDGALTFGFDPASFALAVALAVVANLLECDRNEQLLGLRVGNGLCVKTGEWCSSRSLLGCREERESYCCYNSRLAKLVATEAQRQLGLPPTACDGLRRQDLEALDFSRIDLAPVLAEFQPPDVSERLHQYRADNAARHASVTVLASQP